MDLSTATSNWDAYQAHLRAGYHDPDRGGAVTYVWGICVDRSNQHSSSLEDARTLLSRLRERGGSHDSSSTAVYEVPKEGLRNPTIELNFDI